MPNAVLTCKPQQVIDKPSSHARRDLRFSIVTPSYRSVRWLPLCIASVADQEGVDVEHIVQDSCSDDGTQDLLRHDSRVKAFIEKDQGMYDAVNRGFSRATGDILAYLNCDEQYLPGALKAVSEFFNQNPSVDAVLSDTVVTDAQGTYICHRYSLVPRQHQLWVRFPVLTCSLFVRKAVVHDLGIRFDTRWRDLGDFFWVQEMVRRKLRFEILPRLTSVFTDTGQNMNLGPNGQQERRTKWQMAPMIVKLMKYPFIFLYRLRLAVRGAPFQKPFHYAIYSLENPEKRIEHHAVKPTSFWKGRSRR
jgi:glycosyltransferase involved in cell wall biosynthesis